MAIIESGLEAAVMINKMESKDALATKGSLYVGTGGTTTVTTSTNRTVSIPVTTAFIPETNGGVMIHDNSTDTGWKVDKVKAENLDNDSLAQVCLNLIYPVGSIYMSVKNASPETFLGGTWVAWGSGRVPVGVDTSDTSFDTVEQTGGEKTHTLTESEMPEHKHTGTGLEAIGKSFGTVSEGEVTGGTYTADFTLTNTATLTSYSDGKYDLTSTVKVPHGIAIGGDKAHNNLQPYITCYMWKRVS